MLKTVETRGPERAGRPSSATWLLGGAGMILVVIALLLPRQRGSASGPPDASPRPFESSDQLQDTPPHRSGARRAKSVAYWQNAAQRLFSDPVTPAGSDARKSYGHLAQAQANLFASRNFPEQAEQTHQLATSLWPDTVELAGDYAGFMAGAGRAKEAKQLPDNCAQSYPTNRAAVATLRQTIR